MVSAKSPSQQRVQLRRLPTRAWFVLSYSSCVYVVTAIALFFLGNQFFMLYAFQKESSERIEIEFVPTFTRNASNLNPVNKVDPVPEEPSKVNHTNEIDPVLKEPSEVNQINEVAPVPDESVEVKPVNKVDPVPDESSEDKAFSNVVERIRRSEVTCDKLKADAGNESNIIIRQPTTDVAFLPEFGLKDFIEKTKEEKKIPSWGQCSLPPSKACDLDKVSVILMAYNMQGLQNIMTGLECCHDRTLYPRRIIDEIILVWNGPDRESLENSSPGQKLKKSIDSGKLPMRFFISTEHGLENNLLNRYHPLVSPRNEAILFFGKNIK